MLLLRKSLAKLVRKLNSQTLKAIAYAENALSFVFMDSAVNDFVNNVYLYGSAVRGKLSDDSDIDIFIDCDTGKEEILERIAKAALSRFYQSKDYDKWRLLKFDYAISIQAGSLMDWHLKTSIISESILLYSKKVGTLPAERYVLFIYELPKKKKHYLHFIRNLFGRKEKGYKDTGLLGHVNGKKISTNVIIIPKENQQKIMEFMDKEKISYSMNEICVFS